MTDDELNIVQKVMLDFGGYSAFAKRMDDFSNSDALRAIAAGLRIPNETTRRRIVKASKGRLTESDIIAVGGERAQDPRLLYSVHPMWEEDEDTLRYMIWERARDGARMQLLANRRRRRA